MVCAQVKRDYHDLFNQYAPIWVKEELERGNLWSSFLLSFAPDAIRYECVTAGMCPRHGTCSPESATVTLETVVMMKGARLLILHLCPLFCREEAAKVAVQGRLETACEAGLQPFRTALAEWRSTEKDGAECPPWVPQLRSLVQAGVPRVHPFALTPKPPSNGAHLHRKWPLPWTHLFESQLA